MTRNMSVLEARRQLSFLKSFDKKFQVLDRELQRLNKARNAKQVPSGGWPTDGLERTAKSLIGAGAVYGLRDISAWAGQFLDKLGGIRGRTTPPTQKEMSWLSERIHALDSMQREALERAEIVLAGGGDSSLAGVGRRITPDSDLSPRGKENFAGAGDDAEGTASGAAVGSASRDSSGGEVEDTWESALIQDRDSKAPLGKSDELFTASESALFSEDAPHAHGKKRDASAPADTDNGRESETALHSDTMPVDVIDILEVSDDSRAISVTGSATNVPVLSPLPGAGISRSRILWPAVVGVLILLLGVSLYFNLRGGSTDAENATAARDANTDNARVQDAGNGGDASNVPNDVAATGTDKADTADTVNDTSGDTVVSDGSKKSVSGGPAPKSASRADGKNAASKNKPDTKKSPAKNGSASKTTAKAPARSSTTSSERASDDGPTGRLRVSMPSGVTGDIRIFVDGQKRGKAPKIIRLAPGLHEVRFEMNGKTQLKAVSIREGATRDITPSF